MKVTIAGLFSTPGRPEVTDVIALGDISNEELICIAASAEKDSEHPLGESIVRYAEKKSVAMQPGQKIEGFTAVPGHGIEVTLDGSDIRIGNNQSI